jgi:hypothetical protein
MFILTQPPNNSDEAALKIIHGVVIAVHCAAMFGFVSSKQNGQNMYSFPCPGHEGIQGE